MTHKARGRLARLGVGSLLLLSPLVVVQLSSAGPALAVSGIELVRASSGYSTHYGTQVHGIGGGSSLADSGAYFLSSLQLSTDRQVVTASMTGVASGGMVVQATCAA
jgi:hypothetical protein